MKKNPGIYLEKKPQKKIKKPRHRKCSKKSKPNLKRTLAVLTHKNKDNIICIAVFASNF